MHTIIYYAIIYYTIIYYSSIMRILSRNVDVVFLMFRMTTKATPILPAIG